MSEKKPFRLGILVGRFQGMHTGHEFMINKAVALCEKVGVFIGSSQESRTYKNPFDYEERHDILKTVFGDKIEIYPLPDIGIGNNSDWGDYVVQNIYERFGCTPDLLISGKESRRISWFENTEELNISELYIPKTIDISATRMRSFFVNNDFEEWKKYTNPKLWSKYEKLRETVINSKNNTKTKSI